MRAVIKALAKAFGQLADGKVLGVLAKSVAVTLLVFAVFGAAIMWGLENLMMSSLRPILPQGFEGTAAVLLTAFIVVIAFWFLFRIVALAVLQFFADEIVAAVEAKHYPARAELARPLHSSAIWRTHCAGLGARWP